MAARWLHIWIWCGLLQHHLRVAGLVARVQQVDAAQENPLLVFYETNVSRAPFGARLLKQAEVSGFDVRTLGAGSTFTGYGTKHKLIMDVLRRQNPERLVVVSDYEDVLLNLHSRETLPVAERLMAQFQAAARNKPGTVVVSAEAQCCVGSLSRYAPGSIIASNGTRLQRTCSSGQPNCKAVWGGEVAWRKFQLDLAQKRHVHFGAWTPSPPGQYRNWYVFLNAGLLAGRARDVLELYGRLDLDDAEDDQVLMTELMFRRPDLIMLDYGQRLFGNMVHALGNETGCVVRPEKGLLVQTETGSSPLFLHGSNHLVGCLKKIAAYQDEAAQQTS
eukprot:TRINITY_DN45295_c0_g1_i1.p1 TRINITY_DN45295_c0_g1~~TRINITY_DN45295_c0_g1_i1.p1  ORF type:complete len:332 (+),score=48.27 TRINITY_DN45295_c0_g1_i1:51-1046(+)